MAVTSRFYQCLCAALLLAAGSPVQAWSDNSASEYTFTQNISLDPDDDGPQQPPNSSKTILCASSLLYDDGEFLVTSQAMMINGGDLTPPAFDDYSDLDDSDDEDDDDNDGHSSMLSNSSVRRSLASANGSGAAAGAPLSSYKSPKSSTVVPTSMNASPPARTKRAFGL
eukprot:CAMPEP_0119006562 /NCGR_PEP_ID=MMETSP1176-20130426/2369_1 /TAXON_ID=265551 /ORGANISM="Synedropsis recta cf, Strain CCMP1620" /LENGTH=168 /DNA_ID=CAMNT_0006958491 /DNA_START=62 /DNA_END=568 /DNA_ORIENTATION=-